MNITRIHIENLRSIAKLELDLVASEDGRPRRRVILLGGNGRGKTTMLAAIAHAIGRHDKGMGARMLGADDIRQARNPPADTSPETVRSVIAIEIATSREDREWWALYGRGQAPPEQVTLEVSLGPAIPDAHSKIGPLDRRRLTVFTSDSKAIKEVPQRAMITGPRQPPAVLLPGDRGTLENTVDIAIARLGEFSPRKDCLSVRRDRFATVPGLLALAFLAPDRNDRDGTVRRMWNVLARYLPEMPRPAGVHGLQLLFETSDGAIVGFERLSDGQRAILLLLGELALRNPAGGIVLIDEIEQHLHPRWQRAVLEALIALLPDAQFIITTQAPYVAACAPDDVFELGDWSHDGPT